MMVCIIQFKVNICLQRAVSCTYAAYSTPFNSISIVYDAGAQILFNALDWLLPPGMPDPVTPPRVGKMASPLLGILMLLLVGIGLICSDGFLGFSYLASLFVKGVMPHTLRDEAFSALHKKLGVIPVDEAAPLPETQSSEEKQLQHQSPSSRKRPGKSRSKAKCSGNADDEIAALLGS